MQKKLSGIVIALLAVGSLAFASNALASNHFSGSFGFNGGEVGTSFTGFKPKDRGDRKKGKDKEVRSVPELDSAGAPIALALVGGIAGLAIERRRRKNSKK